MTAATAASYADRAISGELAELAAAPAGRNNTLFRAAARCYQFAIAGVRDEAALTDELTAAGLATGLSRAEVRDTLRSARRRAAQMDDAARMELAARCAGQHSAAHPPAPAAPEPCEAPCATWQAAGGAFVRWSQARLASDAPGANTTYEYLMLDRGLTPETIAAAGLGYNPTGRWSERSKWGVGSDDEGRERMWLPAGIVIPWYVGGELWKISIRRDHVKPDQARYKTLSGSSNALYGADALRPGRPAMLVEGVFDALAVRQAAGDLIAPVACGTSGARRVRWLAQLAVCRPVLNSLDADAAGDACRYWIDALGYVIRPWRPYWGDPAQMLEDGADLRAWVLAGLDGAPEAPAPPAPWALPGATGVWAYVRAYWAAEVAAGSAAVARLRRICADRGYDAAATLRALESGPGASQEAAGATKG